MIVAACQSAPDAPEVVNTPVATAPAAPPTLTPTVTVEPTETPRPSPTPIVSRMDVEAQAVDETAVFTINEAVMTEPGWVVVFNTVDGEAGEVIGQMSLPFGVSDSLAIELDLGLVTEQLIVQLFEATELSDEFDLETLVPVSPPVAEQVTVTLNITQPEIVVEDQIVTRDGLLLVESVLSNVEGWLLVSTIVEDELGEAVGIVHVPQGLSNDVVVPIRWREADDALRLTLLEDNGRSAVYEPESDTPVIVATEPIQTDVEVELPIDVLVYDQPLADGLFTVDRVISPAAGWLAIYQDDDDAPGFIIGSAFIEAGRNEAVVVDVIDSGVTSVVYIILHRDSNRNGEFDLPANDPPFLEDGRQMNPFIFNTRPRDYLVASSQPLQEQDGETGVELSILSVQVGAWVIAHTVDEDGEIDQVLSETAVSAGYYRDLFIPIPEAFTGETVTVSLYTNAGDPELFEPEEAIDVPIRLNLQPLQLPLAITGD